MVLFGTIKGIKADSIVAEANKRIEEVRLSESANQRAGAFSGGMKRRLSVAVALIGNPEVVSLLFYHDNWTRFSTNYQQELNLLFFFHSLILQMHMHVLRHSHIVLVCL